MMIALVIPIRIKAPPMMTDFSKTPFMKTAITPSVIAKMPLTLA